MNARRTRTDPRSPRRQRGIAAILIILLTGLSLSAAVLGVMSRMNSTQEQSVALSAQTQAQIKTWIGAKILNEYLVSLDTDDPIPNHETDLNPDGVTGLTVSLDSVESEGQTQQFFFDVVGVGAEGTRAEARSRLRVVYERILPSPPGTCDDETPDEVRGVIHFNRNLNLSGSIAVQGISGQPYEINVKGDVTTGGNSITGVNTINSTGSIQLGSGSSFDTLRANGDVQLTGSVSGQQNIQARGNVCVTGGASANGVVKANGTVIGDGSASYGAVSAIGVSDNAGTQRCGTLVNDAYGAPFAVDLRGNSRADSVLAKGSVRINSGSIGLSGSTADALRAEKDLRDTNWGGTEYGQIGGVLRISGSNPAIATWVRVTPGLTVTIAPVEPISIDTDEFDARDIEELANYAFKIVNGYKQVRVRRVNGLADGDYFLFDDTWQYKDYLCPVASRAANSTSGTPRCTTSAASLKTICKGYSASNTCFSYNSGSSKWTIAGNGMAPGVAWFEGNLEVSNGVYFNTFVSTSNITTGGSLNVYAPNFAGYSGQVGDIVYSRDDQGRVSGICDNESFPGVYPLQFCTGGSYQPDVNSGIGNFAFMAGSCGNAECNPYVGGNVTLGSSNNIRGNVKAGNQFVSGGSTTLRGYSTALGLGTTVQNQMAGSTTINLRDLPATFTPQVSGPATGGGGGGGGGGEECPEDPPTEPVVSILWSRYL